MFIKNRLKLGESVYMKGRPDPVYKIYPLYSELHCENGSMVMLLGAEMMSHSVSSDYEEKGAKRRKVLGAEMVSHNVSSDYEEKGVKRRKYVLTYLTDVKRSDDYEECDEIWVHVDST